jgi:hypothetical protein
MSTINVNVVQSTGGTVTINDNLIVTGTNNIRPYKVYTAYMATNATLPLAQVLENTLGATITWTRVGVGEYRGTASSNVFTQFKTVVFMQLTNMGAIGQGFPVTYATARFTDNEVYVIAALTDSDSTRVDDRLGLTPIEIRVYP